MNDVSVDHEVSDTGYSARVRVRGSVSCMGRIGLWLHMGFGSDVSSTVRSNYSVSVSQGGCLHSWYWSVPNVRARVRVRCLRRRTGLIGFLLWLGIRL